MGRGCKGGRAEGVGGRWGGGTKGVERRGSALISARASSRADTFVERERDTSEGLAEILFPEKERAGGQPRPGGTLDRAWRAHLRLQLLPQGASWRSACSAASWRETASLLSSAARLHPPLATAPQLRTRHEAVQPGYPSPYSRDAYRAGVP